MVEIILARQMGVFTKNITKAQATMMSGIAVKTMFLYYFKVLSARFNSDATKAEASAL